MNRRSATREPTMPDMPLGDDGLFLVWGSPGRGPRSRAFARELGIDVSFISATRRRGALMAPYRYLVQGLRTLWILFRRRPRVVGNSTVYPVRRTPIRRLSRWHD